MLYWFRRVRGVYPDERSDIGKPWQDNVRIRRFQKTSFFVARLLPDIPYL
jgi:hypothetical protein